jgi:tetratricopeptide (TPR) repeat protein
MSENMLSNDKPPSHDTLYQAILDIIWHSKFRNLLVTLLALATASFVVWQSLPEKTRLGIIGHFEKSTVDVEVKGFDVLAAGNGDVEFIKQKVERNFANIFSNAGLTVRSDFTANQSPSGARFTISGKISYKSEGDILLSVLLQDANNNDVGSAYIEGPANEIKTLYKVVPSALMSAMDVDFSTLKKLKSHNQPTNSVLAYAYFLQARTEAYEKNFDAAVKYLQRAKEIDPKFAMAYWGIGEVRRLEGNDIEANIWYKKASDIDPDHPKMDIIAGNEMHLVPISLAKRSEERPLPGARAQSEHADSIKDSI